MQVITNQLKLNKMGTRSLTKVIETYQDKDNVTQKQNLICMYRQYDGYPTGHGKELAEFLADRTIVNGYGLGENKNQNNGMGCLSAELLSEFKNGIGNIYCYPPNSQRDWEDFEYVIEGNEQDQLKVKVYNWENKEIFNGNVNEFNMFCDEK
mgnify:CR=1 FL=1